MQYVQINFNFIPTHFHCRFVDYQMMRYLVFLFLVQFVQTTLVHQYSVSLFYRERLKSFKLKSCFLENVQLKYKDKPGKLSKLFYHCAHTITSKLSNAWIKNTLPELTLTEEENISRSWMSAIFLASDFFLLGEVLDRADKTEKNEYFSFHLTNKLLKLSLTST